MAELGQRLPASEFAYWIAYFQLEPWGFCGSNLNAALVASTVANFSGRVDKALSINDFRLDISKDETESEPTVEDAIAYVSRVLS